ncbi:MAG: FliH/SctL family protein [Planctomycetota bacterium]
MSSDTVLPNGSWPHAAGARVLRPVQGADVTYVEDRHFRLEDVDRLVAEISRRSQGRLDALRRAGVELERKLRAKTDESRVRIREALTLARNTIDEETRAAAQRAAAVYAERHREGFTKGEEDGFRKGYEEGLAEGLAAGRRDGREQGEREARAELGARLENEVTPAVACIAEIARGLGERWQQFAASVRAELLELALAVARAVIRRELNEDSRSAVEECLLAAGTHLIACSRLTVEIHPADRQAIEEHLAGTANTLGDCSAVEIVERDDMLRGGCRLVTQSASVDRTVETQLQILESRIREAAAV